MGFFRLLLAFSVVGAHSTPHALLRFVGGELAVQIFYIISGFYMAMVVDSYTSKTRFWASRYLRLYPVYIVCAFLSLIFVAGIGSWILKLSTLPPEAAIFLAFTNFTIFAQDLTMFMGVSNGQLLFVKDFNNSSPPLYTLLLVPQGWSLGVEIIFYALAPYLLKKNIKFLFGVFIASLFFRFVVTLFCGFSDPWSYRFFPSELSVFLLGSIAYKSQLNNRTASRVQSIAVCVLLAIFFIFFNFFPLPYLIKKLIGIVAFFMCINVVFNFTKSSKFDNFIGALSYPVYVSHMFLISFGASYFGLQNPEGDLSKTVFLYSLVLSFSMLLYFVVEKPIDKLRHKFKSVQSF